MKHKMCILSNTELMKAHPTLQTELEMTTTFANFFAIISIHLQVLTAKIASKIVNMFRKLSSSMKND